MLLLRTRKPLVELDAGPANWGRAVASRKLVSQPAPSVRPYAIWSSFPVGVESEAVSSAMEASLR